MSGSGEPSRLGSRYARHGASGDALAFGITDLMTSLAVIFVLLLVVFASSPRGADPAAATARVTDPAAPVALPGAADPSVPAASLQETEPAETLAEVTRLGPILETQGDDPSLLRLMIPESLLKFEFGRSDLTPAADRFLTEMMPVYARKVCGPLRAQVAGVVIEGHTDDQGPDALNLRLSQERSFRVLVRGLEAIRAASPADYDCFAHLASASGRGEHELIYAADRQPDRPASRRVVFKIFLRSAALQRSSGG